MVRSAAQPYSSSIVTRFRALGELHERGYRAAFIMVPTRVIDGHSLPSTDSSQGRRPRPIQLWRVVLELFGARFDETQLRT